MNEDKILRQNKIPGCEKLTRPEEIAALSKYLKKIKETYDEHTELERGTLEIPGKTTGQLKEVKELGTQSIKLKDKGKKIAGLEEETIKLKTQEKINLSEHIEKLTDSNNIDLSTEISKLKVDENISLSEHKESLSNQEEITLNESKERLKVNENIRLNTESSKLSIDNKDTNLSDYKEKLTDSNNVDLSTEISKLKIDENISLSEHKESLSNQEEVSLNETKEGLEVDNDVELNNKVITLENKTKIELSDEKIDLNTGKNKIELEKESVGLEDNRKDLELNDRREGLIDDRKIDLNNIKEGLTDPRKNTELSDYREDITDVRKEKLVDKKETISDKRKTNLNNHKEVFSDNRSENLSDYRENISPEDISGLSDYRENFTDERDINLEDKIIELNNINSNVSLSDYKDSLVSGDFKEVELEDGIINRPENSSSDAEDLGVHTYWNDGGELSNKVINLTPEDPFDDAGNNHSFIDPNDAELGNKKLNLTPENPQDDAGIDHNFINPNEAQLGDGIITLSPNDLENTTFIDPNNATLSDKILSLTPENPQDDAGNEHDFIDPNEAQLGDGIITLTPNDQENTTFIDPNDAELGNKKLNLTPENPQDDAGGEHNFIDPNNAELENKVIKNPENSSSDAEDLGVHTYWNDGGDLEDEVIQIAPNLDDQAGEGHNFMNPSNAELEDEVIPLAPEDPNDNAGNNHSFIDPNNATLSDKILDLAPEDPFDDAGNEHDFIDPNNAYLEDETIYIPANDPESNAGEEHNFMNPDNAQLEDEVVNRPDVSSEDARYTGGGYDYISDTTDYIEQEKIDEHRKKILRPNASELDARIEDLYKYKDNLTDPELYEKVIDLLESIGNDHEYDNLDSTTENFHRMTGIVGSTSWVQKLEALVSAYLSSSTITPQNAHRFENALYSSFIPETRLDNEYNFIDNYAGTHYEEEKTRINETRDKITRPANDPDDNARETDYNYWDKEDSTSELIYTNTNSIKRPVNNPFDDARNDIGNYNYLNKENLTEEELGEYSKQTKIPVEGLDTGGGLFGYGPQSAAEKFKERDKENYDINQARVGVPDYVLSDLLVDSIQNGTYTNFNLGNTDSYLNLLRDITHSDISISRYLRWAAEKACKLNPGGSTTRKILLEETLAALVFARDYVERVTKSNRDRLPGDENWYSSLINGGIGEFVREGVEAGRQWIMGRARNSELPVLPEKDDPLNRPNVTKSEVIDGRPIESDVYQVTGVRSNIGVNFARDYTGGLGLRTTLDDLCKSETPLTLSDLKEALKNAPYITTPGKFGSFDGGKYKSYSLDSNAYWEVVLEPLCYGPLNGGISFLPSIQEINVMNKLQHGVSTAYNGWIPFTSFDLQKSKMIGKSLSLFDGEINYPSSVELTNELRLTIVDDEFKSWRQYFQKCMDVSVYNSTSHKGHFYGKTKNELLKNIKELTIVDKDNICIAFYKNIAFNIRIYLMNPQYSTVKSYNLLCVLKDFSEEYSGDTDGAAQDLNLVFSIVGELDYNIPNNGYVEELDSLPATTINSGFNFPDIIQPRDFSIPNDPDIISPEDWETLGLVGRFGPG